MHKVKQGDEVIVTTGKSRGVIGKVLKCDHENNKVLVEGANLATHYQKANPQKNIAAAMVKKESYIAISNISIYNPATKKADRVGFKLLNDGKKVRYFKATEEVIDLNK